MTLERETGVRLLERAGRGVRLTDAALGLVRHTDVLLDRAARAEADLAAARQTVTGRGRIAAFHSVALRIALAAMAALAREAPRLRCELLETEPEHALPALALGDVDLVLGDEWHHEPLRRATGLEWHELVHDRVHLVLPARHPVARRTKETVPLAELSTEVWATGRAGMALDEITRRTCLERGGFEPDIRHRTDDGTVSVALVARGMAVAFVPELALPNRLSGIALRAVEGDPVHRSIFVVTRATDAARPSTQALVAAMKHAVTGLPTSCMDEPKT